MRINCEYALRVQELDCINRVVRYTQRVILDWLDLMFGVHVSLEHANTLWNASSDDFANRDVNKMFFHFLPQNAPPFQVVHFIFYQQI